MNFVKMIIFMKQINKIKNLQKEIILFINQQKKILNLEYLLVNKIFVMKIVKKL